MAPHGRSAMAQGFPCFRPIGSWRNSTPVHPVHRGPAEADGKGSAMPMAPWLAITWCAAVNRPEERAAVRRDQSKQERTQPRSPCVVTARFLLFRHRAVLIGCESADTVPAGGTVGVAMAAIRDGHDTPSDQTRNVAAAGTFLTIR